MAQERKKAVRRAFSGLAGSPLSKVVSTDDKLFAQLEKVAKEHRKARALQKRWNKKIAGTSQSNKVLRIPKTPDREDPATFDEWWDQFGQRHGRIDLDCGFQPYALDPHLRGATPDDVGAGPHEAAKGNSPRAVAMDEMRFDEGGPIIDADHSANSGGQSESHLLDIFAIDRKVPRNKRAGFSTGLVEGDTEIKLRRASQTSWWIFETRLLREFLNPIWDDDPEEAASAASVLYHFYYESRTDEQIYESRRVDKTDHENNSKPLRLFPFETIKHVTDYRQYLTRRGAAQFESKRGEMGGGESQKLGRLRGGRCEEPNCTQCEKNTKGYDYGRL